MKKPWYERLADRHRKKGINRIILDRNGTEPYLERFYLLPRWATLGLFRIVIHRFWKSDDDGALHSHPWLFWGTRILRGGYTEHTPSGPKIRKPGDMAMKTAWAWHSVELNRKEDGSEQECWTIFLMGPKIKDWGFLDPKTNKFVQWQVYLSRKLKKSTELVSIENGRPKRNTKRIYRLQDDKKQSNKKLKNAPRAIAKKK